MVSLESRALYMERINESLKLKAFHYFLMDKDIVSLYNRNISETEEQFLNLLTSIQANDKNQFKEVYTPKSKSNPKNQSSAPFVNDDYFIFSLIIGICKFNIEKTWINNILSIRIRNATTITFENILNENYASKSNQAEIILLYLQLYNPSEINNNLLNTAYKSIIDNINLFENKNDFYILCVVRAYDLIIYQKEASDGSEVTALKKFSYNFSKRIKVLAWILQLIILFALLYGLFKLPIYSVKTIVFLETYNFVFTLLGAFGITVLGNKIPVFKIKSQELLMRLFGFPKELIKKTTNK